MVTQDQLREHLGRRPFKAFRVMLKGGESLDVTDVAQAVAMARELVVAMPSEDHFRWIRLEHIDRVDAYEAQDA